MDRGEAFAAKIAGARFSPFSLSFSESDKLVLAGEKKRRRREKVEGESSSRREKKGQRGDEGR